MIVVVGSGPAGLAACRALAEAALPVLWLEAGDDAPLPPPHAPDRLAAARLGAADGWKTLLGADLRGAAPADLRSPKLRLAVSERFTARFTAETVAAADGFTAIGTLGAGGLAQVWGAFCPAWDGDDLGGLDLAESYRRMAALLGLSGAETGPLAAWMGQGLVQHPPLPVSPLFQPVWQRAAERAASGFALDRPRLAVDPARCDGCGGCLWGCGAGAVWDGAAERARLAALPHVELRLGVTVERLDTADGVTRLLCRDPAGTRFAIDADTVILAAGALGSARLALDGLGHHQRPVRLLTAPAHSFALLAPGQVGAAVPRRVTGLAQLCFRQDLAGGGHGFGVLYDGAAVPASDLALAMPFSRAGAAAAARALTSALSIGFLYLPGTFSDNRLAVERVDGVPRLRLTGGTRDGYDAAARAALRDAARSLRRLGLWLLPGSARPSPPGAECHYGGTLAEFASADGELAPGLFAADASVLPVMSARHHSFTAMANADRIARRIAATWTESASRDRPSAPAKR